MANPLRTEEDAFRLTLLVAVFALPVIVAALLFNAPVALGVAGGLAYAGLFVLLRKRRAKAAKDSAVDPTESDEPTEP
jgi:hypothetical protein